MRKADAKISRETSKPINTKTKITHTELNELIQEMIQTEFLATQRKQNEFKLNRPGRSIDKEQPIMWVSHPDRYRELKMQLLRDEYYIG